MSVNATLYETHQQLDRLTPVSTSTTVNGTWVSCKNFKRFTAKCQVGAIAASGTFTFRVQQAKDGSGTGAKALKTSAALTDTGDNQDIWLDFMAEDLDVDNGFDFVRIEAIAATAASVIAAELLGNGDARYTPVTQPATLLTATV